MSIFLKFFLYINLLIISFSDKSLVKQGVLRQHRFFINIVDSDQLPMANNIESKIWFKDSSVIYEMKVVSTITNYTDSGIFKKESYDLFKYTYFDLTNLRCQDYYSFSDTALPVCNYQSKPGEPIDWNFYAKRSEIDLAGKMSNMTDTILENKTFKRLRFQHSADGYTDESIYYIDCNAKQNIFHINRSIDEMYPGCKVVKSETRGDVKSRLTYVFETSIIRENLTSQEDLIFSNWRKNAAETKLPVLTCLEVLKKFPISSSPIKPE